MLQIISGIFSKSKLNIWLVYSVENIFLLRFIDELPNLSQHLQELYFGLLAYVATENQFVPFKELQQCVRRISIICCSIFFFEPLAYYV